MACAVGESSTPTNPSARNPAWSRTAVRPSPAANSSPIPPAVIPVATAYASGPINNRNEPRPPRSIVEAS